jgi:thiol-disulfide isomerase/thioredoxin
VETAHDRSAAWRGARRYALATRDRPRPFGGITAAANFKLVYVVVMNFWATWCGPCKVEIPWFVEFSQTFRGRGVVVLGVSMDEDGWKSVSPFLREHRVNYPVVLGNESLAKAYGGVDSLPSTFISARPAKDGTCLALQYGRLVVS